MLSTVQFIVPISVLAVRRGGNVQLAGRNLIRMTVALVSASAIVGKPSGTIVIMLPGPLNCGRGERLVRAVRRAAAVPGSTPCAAGSCRAAGPCPAAARPGGEQRQRAEHQGAPHQRPLDELALRGALFEFLLERLPLLGSERSSCRSSTTSTSGIRCRTQSSAPRPSASEREAERGAQGQVGAQGLVDGVHPEADVGGDEPAPGDERERETRRDYLFDPLGVHDHPRVVRREADDVRRAFGLRDLARAVAALGHGGRPEQARRGRGSADHPVRRSRARGPPRSLPCRS